MAKKVTQPTPDTQAAGPSPMGDAPDLQEMINEAVKRELAAVQGAVAGAVEHLSKQMDDKIDTAFDSKIAGVRQEVTEFLGKLQQAQQPQQAQQAAPPSGNGGGVSVGMKLLETLGPLIPHFLQNSMQPVNPVAQLTAQMQQIGDLAQALDNIRGGSGGTRQTITPKTALDWAKWGHSLGSANKPVPAFETVEFTEPPASNV